MEVLDSTIASKADPLFMQCVTSAHRGRILHLPEGSVGADGSTHYWGTRIKFPLERDNAMLFFAR